MVAVSRRVLRFTSTRLGDRTQAAPRRLGSVRQQQTDPAAEAAPSNESSSSPPLPLLGAVLALGVDEAGGGLYLCCGFRRT